MNDLWRLTLPDWLVIAIGVGVVVDLVITIPLAVWMRRRSK